MVRLSNPGKFRTPFRVAGESFDTTSILNHFLVIGQSLATGSEGSPALSSDAGNGNLMFVGGVANPSNLTSLTTIAENSVETIATSFANSLSALLIGRAYKSAVSIAALGGTGYVGLKKGTAPYSDGIAQVTAMKARAEALGYTYRFAGLLCVHGESDQENSSYQADLVEWQSDFKTDINAITGRNDACPFLHTQSNAWTSTGNGSTAAPKSTVPNAQWLVTQSNPNTHILVGGKYHYTYASSFGVHLINTSYRQLGEAYANAYYRYLLGLPQPGIYPLSALLSGSMVTVSFNYDRNLSGTLVFDTSLVANPGDYGFRVLNGGGAALALSSVAIVNNKVEIIVTSGTPAIVQYAWNGTAGNSAGPATGARGNLRGSIAFPSLSNSANYDWCSAFSLTVS